MTNAPKAPSDTDMGDDDCNVGDMIEFNHHPNHHHDNNNNMDRMMQDDENDNDLQYDVQDHDRVKNISNNHSGGSSSSSSRGHVPPNVMISHKRKQRDDDGSSEESEELASSTPQPDAKKSKWMHHHHHDIQVSFTDPMTREETLIKGWNLGMSFVPPPNKKQIQKLTRLIQRNNQTLLRNDDSRDGNDAHHHDHHCIPNTQKVLIMTVAVDSQFTFNGDEYRSGGVDVGNTDDDDDHDTLSSGSSSGNDDNDTFNDVKDDKVINHGKGDDATMFSSPIKNTNPQQHTDKDIYTTSNLQQKQQQQQQQATSGATHSMIERFSVLIFLSVIVVLALMVINERNINLSSPFSSSSHGHTLSNNGTSTSSSALSNGTTTTTTTTTTILQTSSFVNKNQRLEPIVLKGVMLSHVSNCHAAMVQSMYDHLVNSANSIVVDNNNNNEDNDAADDHDEMNSTSRLLQWFEMRVNDTHIQPYQFHMTLIPNNTYHNNDDKKSHAHLQYDFQLTPSGYMSRYMEARDILSIISNHNDQSQSSQLPPIQIILMDYSIDKTCDEYDKSSGLRNALDYYHRQNNIHNNHMNRVDSDRSSSSVLVIPVPSSRFQLKECQLILQPGSLASNNDSNMVSSLSFGPLIQRLILERYHQKRYPTVPALR